MYPYFYKCFIIILLSVFSYNAFSQASTYTLKDTIAAKKNSFKAGANFLSNNVFMGRTGINKVPIISPDIKYIFKSGLYFSGDMDILPDNKKNAVDGGNLTAGYDFDITDNFEGGVSYSKLLYTANSTLVGSSLTNMFNINFDYNIGDVITPSVSADYGLNSGGVPNDIFMNAGIAHDFIAEKIFGSKDVFIISPTVSANLGTQNFYDAYIKRKVYKNKKINTLVTTFESRLNQFELLDYELSAPLEYKIKHFMFEFIPTYAVVENGFQSAAVAKAVGLSNNTSVFYIETGIALKF